MHIFEINGFVDSLYKNNDYLKLFFSIADTYAEECYENGNDELYIVCDGFKYRGVICYYLCDLINNELGHDAVSIENYGELICFNLNNDEKNEFKTINGLMAFIFEKIDVQDLINLINNNACFIQVYDAKKGEWLYYNSLYDVEVHKALVNKANCSENTIYYEDASYKINKSAIFRYLDYL